VSARSAWEGIFCETVVVCRRSSSRLLAVSAWRKARLLNADTSVGLTGDRILLAAGVDRRVGRL